jgi:hypothetical protein
MGFVKSLPFRDKKYVRKVSSGLEYFLRIFGLRIGLTLKVVDLDAELNSLSNGDIFKWVYRTKHGDFSSNPDFTA